MKTILLLKINKSNIKKLFERSVYTKTSLTALDGTLNKQEDKNEKVDLTFQEAQDAHEAIITQRRAQIENAFNDLDKAEETMRGKINKSTTMAKDEYSGLTQQIPKFEEYKDQGSSSKTSIKSKEKDDENEQMNELNSSQVEDKTMEQEDPVNNETEIVLDPGWRTFLQNFNNRIAMGSAL